MKVSELLRKLEKLGDDMEIFVAPMVEMDVLNEDSKPAQKKLASPFLRFKVINVVQSGSLGDKGVYDFCVLFGFDDSVNYAAESEKADELKFIN